MQKLNIITRFGLIPENQLTFAVVPSEPAIPLDYSAEVFKNFKFGKNDAKIKIAGQTCDFTFFQLNGRVTALPKNLTPALAYFVGYFLGDGGLKDIWKSFHAFGKFDYKIKIADEFLCQVQTIKTLFNDLFALNPPVRLERIAKGEHTFYLELCNKIIFLFLVKIFEVPIGKKYQKLAIPKLIRFAPIAVKQWFLRGLFDADGDTRAVEAGFNS